jgi:molybdenum cofactor cytidylyltransferase
VGAVLLAAGGSTRLGRPKQLIVHDGCPLVARAADAALEAGASPVVVVLGAFATDVRPALDGRVVVIVENPRWQDGMGTSVGVGVRTLLAHAPDVEGILLTLCDQPQVDGPTLARLLNLWRLPSEAGRGTASASVIAAAEYAGTVGVPAVFGRAYLGVLVTLAPDVGASAVVRDARARVRPLPMPAAALDIDTLGDLARLHARPA